MITIDHFAVRFSSRERAERIFAHCLGMRKLRSFTIGSEISAAFFGLDVSIEILVYGEEKRIVEAFILPDGGSIPPPTHVCLKVPDLARILDKAQELGLEIRKTLVGDHEVFFLKDDDENLYEMKQG